MTAPREDVVNKVSVDASHQFVDSYYLALNSTKREIAPFYMPPSAMPDGKTLPIIVFNGNIIPDPMSMQKLFQEQMPRAEYIVGDFDCHVINPNYVPEGAQGAQISTGKNMTILLTVSGAVKYGDSRPPQPLGFSDTIVLSPNPAASGGGRPRNVKEWLVQSQTFRLVS